MNPANPTRARQSGFSLVEILVVLVIMGLLISIVAPTVLNRADEARVQKVYADFKAIETALKIYRLDNYVYPTTEQGLQALVEKPETGTVPKKWKTGGYLEKGRVPKDPWGNDFIYLSPGLKGDFDILSYGLDGAPGGEEENKDINNWEIE